MGTACELGETLGSVVQKHRRDLSNHIMLLVVELLLSDALMYFQNFVKAAASLYFK